MYAMLLSMHPLRPWLKKEDDRYISEITYLMDMEHMFKVCYGRQKKLLTCSLCSLSCNGKIKGGTIWRCVKIGVCPYSSLPHLTTLIHLLLHARGIFISRHSLSYFLLSTFFFLTAKFNHSRKSINSVRPALTIIWRNQINQLQGLT